MGKTRMKRMLLFVIFMVFFFLEVELHGGTVQAIDCPSACNFRCSKASRHNLCLRACNTCCNRCDCVPPGTSGNRDVCPCYAKMTTQGGRLKCP